MAVSAHDQEIGVELGDLGKYRVGNCYRVEIVPDNLHSGIEAMTAEMSHQISGKISIGILFRVDQQDGNRTRRADQR